MAHYAFLDNNNIVTEVITGVDENIIQTDFDGTQVGGSSEAWEIFYGNQRNQVCKRTSYNRNYRKNYASKGMIFDSLQDAFILPKPFNSWILDEASCQWQAPIAAPLDIESNWNESTLSWDVI